MLPGTRQLSSAKFYSSKSLSPPGVHWFFLNVGPPTGTNPFLQKSFFEDARSRYSVVDSRITGLFDYVGPKKMMDLYQLMRS